MLKRTVSDQISYKFGVFYQYFNVNDTSGRFIGDASINRLDSAAYDRHHFTGLSAALDIDTRDNEVLPRRGIHWTTSLSGFYGIDADAKNFARLASDLRLYLSFRSDPRIVFAFRFGGAMNLGEYEFYQANFLGGRDNLRGFRSNRYAGDHSFYQNTEMRVKLMNLRTYIFNGQTGFYLFNDLGRVWVDGEKSTRWHDGYGFGVWMTPFEFTALTFSYNLSHDDRMFAFSLKFLF
jgi:hemolysin activation/secretion protein